MGTFVLVRVSTLDVDVVSLITVSQTKHYENTPMQYTAIFHGCKNASFQLNFADYFHIFAQNIYCGYTLEPPH